MKVKYVKNHNNYDFVLGQVYEASKYKNGWLMIEGQLYREECFDKVIGVSSIKEIMNKFNNQGVDDLQVKKNNEITVIGYFEYIVS